MKAISTCFGFLLAGIAMADAPLPPPAPYVICSPSGSHCTDLSPEKGARAYIKRDKKTTLWTLSDWHRYAYLADGGEYFASCPGGGLVPQDEQEWHNTPVLVVFKNGKELKTFTLSDLGFAKDQLLETASHYRWGDCSGFDHGRAFLLNVGENKQPRSIDLNALETEASKTEQGQ